MSVRVVHWGVGQTGRVGLQGVLGHADLTLVGLFVQRPKNVGRDAGELCDRPLTGVRATNKVDEILALKPDCLAYFGVGATDERAALNNILPFLEAGCDVVTTVPPRLVWPPALDATTRSEIMAACNKGGSRLFSTGIEPGFASDLFPYTLLSIVDEIDLVHVTEIANYGRYNVENSMRNLFGFGQKMDFDVPVLSTALLEKWWGPVVIGLAHDIGVEIDKLHIVTERVATPVDLKPAFGHVSAGTIAGIRYEVQGIVDGRPLVTLEHINYIDDDVAPHWDRAKLGKDVVYRVRIKGRPNMESEISLPFDGGEDHGLIATAMRAINAIPVLRKNPPGLLAPLDIPARPSGNIKRARWKKAVR